MHQPIDDREIIRVTDDTTRPEIEDAIRNVLASVRRLRGVTGFYDRGHERINAPLDDWQAQA